MPSKIENNTSLTDLSHLDTELDSLLEEGNSLISTPLDFINDIVRLIIILDISSSMEETIEDITEGLKKLVAKHKNHNILFNLVVFNDEREVLIDDTYIENVAIPEISADGFTNLNGSIYHTLHDKCQEGVNLAVTISDGADNVGEVSEVAVSSLMNELNSEHNHFYFLGEPNIEQTPEEVYKSACKLGFDEDNISIFTRKKNGNKLNFEVISSMLEELLTNGSISKDWANPIKEHYLALEKKRR